MRFHDDTGRVLPYLLGGAALFSFLAGEYLFGPEIAFAKKDRIFQPTDPCEVVVCPPPPEVTTQFTGGIASSDTQENIKPRSRKEVSASSEVPAPQSRRSRMSNQRSSEGAAQADKIAVTDEKELNRILSCSAAFKTFSEDGKGGELNWNHAQDYLDKCLHKANDLPPRLKLQLYSTVVTLQGKDGGSYCTGSLLNNRLVLTARHCLINQNDFEQSPKHPINKALLSALVIKGIGADGNGWSRKAVSVYFDPFDAASPAQLVGNYDNRRQQYPKTLDFVAIQLDSPIMTMAAPISLATDHNLTSLTTKQRLLLGFFRQDKKDAPPTLYVDDLASCLIREVDTTRGYLHHHCQTYTSVSGAAIFMYGPKGELTIIAVHVASAGSTMAPEKTPVTGNEGAIIPVILRGIQ